MDFEYASTESSDVFEDLICGLGPHERLRFIVRDLQEASDIAFECLRAVVHSALDASIRDEREVPLDVIEPGTVGRSEVDVESRMARQPCPRALRLVSDVVVQDEVDVELAWNSLIDLPQELQKLVSSMPAVERADDLSGGNVQCSEQGGRSVAGVAVCPLLGSTRLHR